MTSSEKFAGLDELRAAVFKAIDFSPVTPTQAQIDAVLLDYLQNIMPLAEAQARLAKMDTNAKLLEARHFKPARS